MKAETAARLALVVGSILVTLFVLELGARLWRGPSWLMDWRNFVVDEHRPNKEAHLLIPDPELGSVPRPSFVKLPYTHDAQGFRSLPPPPPSAIGRPPLLATGDSLAYGAEVGDGESWPAYLQDLLGWRVVNAGVPGYGLDQIVLRTEKLSATVRPAVLIVSFIADDVHRLEMSRLWGREKPYFQPNGDALESRHIPVPADPSIGSKLPLWEQIFGWSVLADVLRGRLLHDPFEWFGDHERALPLGTGDKMACPLMKRLATLGIPTLVVAQYDPIVWANKAYGVKERQLSQRVLGCAAEAGLATLDLFEPIDRTVRLSGLTALYGDRSEHHNPAGNGLVAELIAAELERRRMLP